MKGYKGKLKDGREVFIPHWPVDVAVENLAKAGKFLGTDELVRIADINIPAVIISIANAEDPGNVAGIINHFCTAARIDGNKLSIADVNEEFRGQLELMAEVFATVVHAQYHSFFESGLAKASSQ